MPIAFMKRRHGARLHLSMRLMSSTLAPGATTRCASAARLGMSGAGVPAGYIEIDRPPPGALEHALVVYCGAERFFILANLGRHAYQPAYWGGGPSHLLHLHELLRA